MEERLKGFEVRYIDGTTEIIEADSFSAGQGCYWFTLESGYGHSGSLWLHNIMSIPLDNVKYVAPRDFNEILEYEKKIRAKANE